MKYALYTITLLFALQIPGFMMAQTGPWNSPLKMAWSNDGITFGNPAIFQDSAGVPTVIRWKGDTLIAAFQWFRQPNPSPSWDRVAIKFSYDNGISWTVPSPVVFNNFPTGYQRPFDPTLVLLPGDSLRMYFSSSNGTPTGGLDSTVNTYSAVSTDGINYNFESGVRVDVTNNRVIDPAVIHFNNSWHYISPKGAPQDGAYHFVSPDGLNYMQVPDIPSNAMHNWTGNYMVEDSTLLRFYGSGGTIWFNSTPNGGVWNGYTSTNMNGGDPSVLKTDSAVYLMIFVGQPYTTSTTEHSQSPLIGIHPNPAQHAFQLNTTLSGTQEWVFYHLTGGIVYTVRTNTPSSRIVCDVLPEGVYLLCNRQNPDMNCKIQIVR